MIRLVGIAVLHHNVEREPILWTRCLGRLWSSGTTAEWTCLSHPPDLHAVPARRHRVHRWTHVEHRKLVRLWIDHATIVVIDDVAHRFAAAVNNPVVSVKWQLVPATSHAISCRDHLWNNLDCIRMGLKLYSLTQCRTIVLGHVKKNGKTHH